ncbi:hypothetical protein V8C42DRAFT_332770 [Trichoderma barbatum]
MQALGRDRHRPPFLTAFAAFVGAFCLQGNVTGSIVCVFTVIAKQPIAFPRQDGADSRWLNVNYQLEATWINRVSMTTRSNSSGQLAIWRASIFRFHEAICPPLSPTTHFIGKILPALNVTIRVNSV